MSREESKEEFVTKVCKKRLKGVRKFKVTDSWGVYDAYKQIRKGGWQGVERPLKEHEFYAIVRKMNNLLAEEIAQGKTVNLLANMGRLELRKFEARARLKDGKLKVTYPVDWKATMQLWYEDEEAYNDKTLIRNMGGSVYRVYYNKGAAKYPNKIFYEFHLNRKIKQRLKENIKNGEVSSGLLLNYYGGQDEQDRQTNT